MTPKLYIPEVQNVSLDAERDFEKVFYDNELTDEVI